MLPKLGQLYLIGLAPIKNGRCAYACVFGFKEQSEASQTESTSNARDITQNDISVELDNQNMKRFSGVPGASSITSAAPDYSAFVPLHDPYPAFHAAEAAPVSEPVASPSSPKDVSCLLHF